MQECLDLNSEDSEKIILLFDSCPVCCNFWDENMNNILCNQEAVNLFELSSKEEYLSRFFDLSPKYQPDGMLSYEKGKQKIKEAFDEGKVVFEWLHQKLNGEPIPTKITLIKLIYNGRYIVAGYTSDLRKLNDAFQSLENLQMLVFKDELTGIYNYRYFSQVLTQLIKKRTTTTYLLYLDLDFFKKINDNHGHEGGNYVLKNFTNIINKELEPDMVFARLGGEEFVILGTNKSHFEVLEYAWKINKAVSNASFTYKKQKIDITVSIGFKVLNPKDSSKDFLIHADNAMYIAKRRGRNTVIDYAEIKDEKLKFRGDIKRLKSS